MEGTVAGHIARSERARKELARAWLVEIIESTPPEELEALPIAWIVDEAPALIEDILGSLADPAAPADLDLPPEGLERIGQLGRLRAGEGAAARLPRDLAALQALLIEALTREVGGRGSGSLAASVERLAEIFGALQGTLAERLVEERSGAAARDLLTGLAGEAQLHEWLQVLLAEHRRYEHPFSLAAIDIEGLARVNDAYGREAGDRIVSGVADVVRRQIRAVDKAFRVSEGQICVLAPHQRAEALRPLAERLCAVIEGSQGEADARVALAIGIAACPGNGESADQLISAAEEAAYAAKASGRHISVLEG